MSTLDRESIKKRRGSARSSFEKPIQFPELKGYLKKKSRQDKWQRRWFEANDTFLTYYKVEGSEKLLACIDLTQVNEIARVDNSDQQHLGEFYIGLGERFYVIRAETDEEAKRWVEGLKLRQQTKNASSTSSDLAATENNSGNEVLKVLTGNEYVEPGDNSSCDTNSTATGALAETDELDKLPSATDTTEPKASGGQANSKVQIEGTTGEPAVLSGEVKLEVGLEQEQQSGFRSVPGATLHRVAGAGDPSKEEALEEATEDELKGGDRPCLSCCSCVVQ